MSLSCSCDSNSAQIQACLLKEELLRLAQELEELEITRNVDADPESGEKSLLYVVVEDVWHEWHELLQRACESWPQVATAGFNQLL